MEVLSGLVQKCRGVIHFGAKKYNRPRIALIKTIGGGRRSAADRELAIQQIVSRAMVSTEIVDIMAAIGLDRPDISILSDDFLAEVRDLDKKNLAIEALRKLLNGQVPCREGFARWARLYRVAVSSSGRSSITRPSTPVG